MPNVRIAPDLTTVHGIYRYVRLNCGQEFVMFSKRYLHLMALLCMLILAGSLHNASSNAIQPDTTYATQKAVDTLHDIRDALR